MNVVSIGDYLYWLLPHVVLAVVGLGILLADLIDRGERKGWPPYVALVGLIAGMVTSALRLGADQTLLGGMIRIDAFSIFFDLIALGATALVVLSAITYVPSRTRMRGEFYGLLVLVALAMSLTAASDNLIMLFVAFETLSIASYILVGFLRDDPKSNEAAIKYFLYGAVSSAIMLYGMSLLYGFTGSVGFREIAAFFGGNPSSPGLWVAVSSIILMLAGFGFKIALVPFHQWSPDTYEGAPTPVTAFLSVGPKAIGFAVLIRVLVTAVPTFFAEWAALLAGVSILTMTVGNLIALRQTNIKRMLAYSSIAQAGYILIGVVSAAPDSNSPFNGINGTLVYLLAYLFTNLGAFMTVIAFEEATGSTEIRDYAGLMKRSPWMAGTMLVFLLSLAGIPATGGFIGKLFVFGAAIQVQLYALAIVGIINSAIAVYYYFTVVRYMFFTSAAEGAEALHVPAGVSVVLAVSLIMTLAIGLYPSPFLEFASGSATLLATL